MRRGRIACAAALIIAAAAACGGKVTFVTGSGSGGEGGAAGNECFLGHCGDACIKCIGDQCDNGKCDAKGLCQPPDVTFTCPP